MTYLPTDILVGVFVALERCIPHMTAFELAWSIWALGRMDVSFTDIPVKTHQITMDSTINQLKNMEMRELGVVMYAITSMKIPMINPLVEEIFKKLN